MWAQAIHTREPTQFASAPADLASELEGLLRAVALPMGLVSAEPPSRYLTPHDLRHQQTSRIQAILIEIRATPGLDRFMLGYTYDQLREVAREHPVVVLMAAQGHVYALILSDSLHAVDVLKLAISWDSLLAIEVSQNTRQSKYRTASEGNSAHAV
jgi:hypothetical protein